MGSGASRPNLYTRVARAIPPVTVHALTADSEWAGKGVKVFASEKDREQFIYGLISLMTSNGSINLDSHEFKLLYSRRQPAGMTTTNLHPPPAASLSKADWLSTTEPEEGTRFVVTFVAIDATGYIKTKLEPEADGKTMSEAFRAFKHDVEFRLEGLLRSVPNGAGMCQRDGDAVVAGVDGEGGHALREGSMDAPPAYDQSKKA